MKFLTALFQRTADVVRKRILLNRSVKYAFITLIEAIVCLIVIHLPLLLLFLFRMTGAPENSNASEVAWELFFASFSPKDIMGYTAGLLASSTAFFVINIKFAKVKPLTVVAFIVLPILILFFAVPLYFQAISGGTPNHQFASWYSITIVGAAIVVWLVSLYKQKTLVLSDETGEGRPIAGVREPE